ncbi:MAG: peptidase prepilin type [Blastococcus sp.]|nr:peptidase prepilin type [Blastococcus sp.]
MTALLAAAAGLLGLAVAVLVNRAAGRYPWDGPGPRGRATAVRPPVVEIGTALLFALVALRFGSSWELPAYLFLAGSAVLLAVIDLQHHKLPNRVVLPSIAVGAVLLTGAAAGEQAWPALLRAGGAGTVLFAVYLVLALISPRSLGMGDVKLAALLGLYLGWLGWGAVVLGAAAGFAVQALVALVLLAGRRVSLRGELPFGPAMLLGAAVVIGWSGSLLP